MTMNITNPKWLNSAKSRLQYQLESSVYKVATDTQDEPYKTIVADILAGVYGPIEAAEPEEIPQVISMRQCRLQLLELGMLDDVDVAIQSMPSPAKEQAEVEWEYATEVKRTSSLVLNLGGALGLSSDDMDELFKSAAKL